MEKILKIAGIILVAWVALGLFGWVFHFLVSAVFWVGLIAAGIWVVGSLKGRNRTAVNAPRDYHKLG